MNLGVFSIRKMGNNPLHVYFFQDFSKLEIPTKQKGIRDPPSGVKETSFSQIEL
jgi:hypothetical protein